MAATGSGRPRRGQARAGDHSERRPPLDLKERYAAHLVPRFRALLQVAAPPDAEIVVVSKGDRALVEVEGRRTSHFPQRADGVYAGYYPPDSSAAIAHLEAVRQKGAQFLAFPATAVWWLKHYEAFGRHLEERYRVVAREDQVGVVYALADPLEDRPATREAPEQMAHESTTSSTGSTAPALPEGVADEELLTVFHAEYYAAQAGIVLESADAALAHYLSEGHRRGLSPHPLFDVTWYVARYPEAAQGGADPFLHFVRHGAERQLDPSPYFDSAYYYEQAPDLLRRGRLALAHYVAQARQNASFHPNPLFRDGFYLRLYNDARRSQTPLEHFLHVGWREGRFASHVHRDMAEHLAKSSRGGLVRGRWKSATVLFHAYGERRPGSPDILGLADELAERFHIDSIVVASRRPAGEAPEPTAAKLLVLEDYQLAGDVMRPSAQRLLAKALTGTRPLFAVAEVPEILEVLASAGVGSYFLLPGAPELPPRRVLEEAFRSSTRVVVPSSQAFSAAAGQLSRFPANVALRPPEEEGYVESVLELAERDLGIDADLLSARRLTATPESARKVVIPCSDWGVSGVNASLEALGRELIRRGWDVEILFTRDQRWVSQSSEGGTHMPGLPYRFLDRRRAGIDGLWEALIADLERAAPAIVLTSYDFLANGAVSALTDQVGVVMWVQADDGDYYEQAYRLGRYCDAIVCVSESLRENVVSLNPALTDRTQVIHNSSVWESDVVGRRPARKRTLRIVYSGRLVQYQKRILDFVELAKALDLTDVPYEITLIGAFPGTGNLREVFERDAAEHIADGRIRLPGRLGRSELFAELEASDFFVLLSDFEGLPLALVEAMARGCVPVAAEMDSGIPEIITDGENGLIVPGRDYDEWAQAIVGLFGDRRRLATLGRQARRTVKERFTVEHAASRFSTIFEEVARQALEGRERRPPALHWGIDRSWTGDVLPPPSIVRPSAVSLGGLR